MNNMLHPKPLRLARGALSFIRLGAASIAQTATLVSGSSGANGAQGNGDSPYVGAKISGNGQSVVFRSAASNLVAGEITFLSHELV